MSAIEIKDQNTKIAQLIADTAPNNWREIRINMELIVDGSEVAQSYIARCFVGDTLEKIEYRAPYEVADYLLELNDLMSENNERWKICNFIVFNYGEFYSFKADFSYDAPPRLSGDLLAGTM
jgi:hypothetical protein